MVLLILYYYYDVIINIINNIMILLLILLYLFIYIIYINIVNNIINPFANFDIVTLKCLPEGRMTRIIKRWQTIKLLSHISYPNFDWTLNFQGRVMTSERWHSAWD